MTITTKRRIAFAGGLFIGAFTAWLLGFDFDERGPEAAMAFIASLMLAVVAATYPFTEETK